MNETFLSELLAKRKAMGSERTLPVFQSEIDLFSNDYLGFSKFQLGIHTSQSGSTGSRLMSGNSSEAQECELFLAGFFQTESTLVYSSGYAANLGFWSSVPQRGDLVLYDEYCHASCIDGLRLSFADRQKFLHNDLVDLENKLKSAKNKRLFIAIEGVYSMNGTVSPLDKIAQLATDYKALLVIDEAHSIGVIGESGRGLANFMDVEKSVFARIVTFGKAYGFHGAAVLGSKVLRDYLVNFSRSFIYSTALPPTDYLEIMERVSSTKINSERQKLEKVISVFQEKLSPIQSLSSSKFSPIQMIYLPNKELNIISQKCIDSGIFTKPILPPTVPEGQESLRFCLHSFNTNKELDVLEEIFKTSDIR